MNDLYARDTSSKIKAVKLSTFKSGKYVGCYAPLGYKKSEADKHVLEIDPVTAPVVRHIFDLRLQGYGFRKIALQLNAEKSLRQGAFTTWQRDGKTCGARHPSGMM